jgi:hypothetical protein
MDNSVEYKIQKYKYKSSIHPQNIKYNKKYNYYLSIQNGGVLHNHADIMTNSYLMDYLDDTGIILRALQKIPSSTDADWKYINTVYRVNSRNEVIDDILPKIREILKSHWPTSNKSFVIGVLSKCDALKILSLPDDFNEPITIPDSVEKIIFGVRFNSAITWGPNTKIKKIFFSKESRFWNPEIRSWVSTFNQPITIPDSVEKIQFGGGFNSTITWGPKPQIKELVFNEHGNFNQQITIPDSLEKIQFGREFNSLIKWEPKPQIKELIFNERGKFNKLITIPDSVEKIKFGEEFNSTITWGPKTQIKELVFSEWAKFNKPITIPDSIEKIIFGGRFNIPITWGPKPQIKKLINFNYLITIPDSVEKIVFGYFFNQPIAIPDSVKIIQFEADFNSAITWGPDPQIEIIIFNERGKFNQPITIPDSVKKITFGWEFKSTTTWGPNPQIEKLFCLRDTFENLEPSVRKLLTHHPEKASKYNMQYYISRQKLQDEEY